MNVISFIAFAAMVLSFLWQINDHLKIIINKMDHL